MGHCVESARTEAILHGAVRREARGGLTLEDGARALAGGICQAAARVGDRLKEAGELQGFCGSAIPCACEPVADPCRGCKGPRRPSCEDGEGVLTGAGADSRRMWGDWSEGRPGR